jgi:SIR2-like domain
LQWAKTHSYPLDDHTDLAKVAQYLAVTEDFMSPKERIAELFEKVKPPDFNEKDEPHAVLADLPLPVYITTNYDDFMVQAMRHRNRDPKQELCRWNDFISQEQSVFATQRGYIPTVANPLVFHLHGAHQIPESLVLTEDDYLDFIVEASKNETTVIPLHIQRALTGTSLLFLGYRIADWDFRVLFRSLSTYMKRSTAKAHVSVQLVPLSNDCSEEQSARAQDYLNRYFRKLDIRVYWGSCREFASELRRRWNEFKDKPPEGA